MRRNLHKGTTSRAFDSVESCSRCRKGYNLKLPACPYCGRDNKNTEANDSTFIDVKKSVNILDYSFYFWFMALAVFCFVAVILHDVVENITNNISPFFITIQGYTYSAFWIAYPVLQGLFCYWLYSMYSVMARLGVHVRFPLWMAWTMFIPILNLYMPIVMIREVYDYLDHLKVKNLNFITVNIWRGLQIFVNLYLLCASFIHLNFYLIILVELIWAVCILYQGLSLNGFYHAVSRRSERALNIHNTRRRRY